MTDFELRTDTQAGRTVVTLTGECDLTSRDALASGLLGALDGAEAVYVDLSALRFLDSSGVHVLVTTHHAAKERGGHLYLVNATGPVAVVLSLTGVDELLRPPDAGHHD